MSEGSTVVCCEGNRLMKSLLKCAVSVFVLHEAAALKPVTPEPEQTGINGRQGLEFCNSCSQYFSAWHCAFSLADFNINHVCLQGGVSQA